jgi:uncharacterized protein with beta-barrel porin domain
MMNRKSRRRAEAIARKNRVAKVSAPSSAACPSPRPHTNALKSALLTTAAAGAILATVPTAARAQIAVPPSGAECTVVGSTATCTGDVSPGIDVDGTTIDTLNVNNLTTAITPDAGTDGIHFSDGSDDITIDVDTGTFGITTSGNDADGIYTQRTDANTTITSAGNISTDGSYSDGIDARVAGDGDITITSTGNVSTTGFFDAQGISGGVDGSGDITITSTGNVSTDGFYSDGIDARVAGDGDITITSTGNVSTTGFFDAQGISGYVDGSGGITITSTGNVSTAGEYSGGIRAEVDETGDVTITSTGNVSTTGSSSSDGIYARARDEGTSNGNVTITSTGNLTTAGERSRGISARGDGDVSVTSVGEITTSGDRSAGIFAFADDVGDSSVMSTGNISTGGEFAGGIVAGVNEGNVTITSEGNVSTSGGDSSGVGAYVGGEVVGTGNITITSTGDVTTTREGSDAINSGIYGYGDISITSVGNLTTWSGESAGISANVGEHYSGDGGDGNITITSTGNITTAGYEAIGINTEIYGDGNITISSTGNTTTSREESTGINAEIYGDGNITISSTGNTTTSREESTGINAEIYGDGNITISSTGNITTLGYFSDGIYGQVNGNGNVTISSAGNVSTSGEEADAIDSSIEGDGDITITSVGNITTFGEYSRGVDAYVEGDGNIAITSTGDVWTSGEEADAIDSSIEGDGDITITSTGDVSTSGEYSDAVDATVDGDGNVTITSSGNVSTSGAYSDALDARLRGGGTVQITSTGDVTTTGDRATGIEADVDGSGDITITSTGDITTTGESSQGIDAVVDGTGNITITSTGNITINNNDADAVEASVRGGAGTVTVNLSGGTVQGGNGEAAGVDFSSSGDGATNTLNNDATLTALSTVAVLGSWSEDIVNNTGTIIGQVFLFGDDDTVNLDASGTTTDATFDGGDDTDTFILSGTASNTLDGAQHENFEELQKTGSGTWTLTGTHNFSQSATIGEGTLDLSGTLVSPTVTNQATLSAGGVGTIGKGEIDGNLVQTGAGRFAVDVDLATETSDHVEVTGTAVLSGKVVPTFKNSASGSSQYTILSAAGGTTVNGLGLENSVLYSLQLLYPNANDVVLGITVDMLPTGLNNNQSSIANTLNGAGGTLGPLVDAILQGVSTLEDYQAALDQLSPESVLNNASGTVAAGEEFTNNLFSCPVTGTAYAFIAEGQCVWVRPEGRYLQRDGTDENIGYEATTGAFSAGAQLALGRGWFLGGGLGYEASSLQTNSGASTDGDRFTAGGVLKYQTGPFLMAAAVTGGIGSFETDRAISIADFQAVASSDYDIGFVVGQLRAAYLLQQRGWYAKPLVDLNVTHLDRDAINETGGGEANLIIDGADETYFSVIPAIEFGTEFGAAGVRVRPFVKAGVAFFSDDEHTLTARFAGAPSATGAFTIRSDLDDVFADIEAGATVFDESGATLSVTYEGRYSDNTDQHGFVLKGTAPF